MSAPAGPPPRIQIPRWIQLVGLPVRVFFAWVFGQAVGHTVFLFLVAALIALLLDPIVLALGAFKVRRGFSVALVYLTFAAAIIVHLSRSGPSSSARRRRPRTGSTTISPSSTDRRAADRDVDRLQLWLDTHHLQSIKVQQSGHRIVERIRERDVGKYTHRIVNFVEGAAISIGRALFDFVLIVVVSIYMLLDMQRLSRAVDRRFPPHGGGRCSRGWSTRSSRTCAGRSRSA